MALLSLLLWVWLLSAGSLPLFFDVFQLNKKTSLITMMHPQLSIESNGTAPPVPLPSEDMVDYIHAAAVYFKYFYSLILSVEGQHRQSMGAGLQDEEEEALDELRMLEEEMHDMCSASRRQTPVMDPGRSDPGM